MTTMWKNASTDEVDPKTLIMDDNNRYPFNDNGYTENPDSLRKTLQELRPDLWDSIELHGVKDIIRVNPSADGTYRVRDGHWRTLIARFHLDAHPLVPILITDDEDIEPWHRIRDQYLFNELGKGYTDGEKAEIVGKLALFDLTDNDIATELSLDPTVVTAGLAVQKSPKTLAASRDNPQWDMLQLQALAEFDDGTDAHDRLVTTLQNSPGLFHGQVAELRRARQVRDNIHATQDTFRQQGIHVLDLASHDDLPDTVLPLHQLYVSADDSTMLTAESHEQCPGRGAVVTADYRGQVRVTDICVDFAHHGHRDKIAASVESAIADLHQAGVAVVDELPDTASSIRALYNNATDRTQLDPDAHATCAGHAAMVEAHWTGEPDVTFVCLDFAAHGHVPTRGDSAPSTVTDEYRKGEFNRATANNAKWDVQIGVRRKWLAENLFANVFGKKPKTPSRAQHRMVEARMIDSDRVAKARASGHSLACALLGLKPPQPGKPNPISSRLKNANQSQALLMDLAMLVGGLESHYDRKHSRTTWRTPTEIDKFFFGMLKAWGYPLDPVEQLVLDPTGDDEKWAHLRPQTRDDAPTVDVDDELADLIDEDCTTDQADDTEDEQDHDVDVDDGAVETGPDQMHDQTDADPAIAVVDEDDLSVDEAEFAPRSPELVHVQAA